MVWDGWTTWWDFATTARLITDSVRRYGARRISPTPFRDFMETLWTRLMTHSFSHPRLDLG
jgi:hypothetical protein